MSLTFCNYPKQELLIRNLFILVAAINLFGCDGWVGGAEVSSIDQSPPSSESLFFISQMDLKVLVTLSASDSDDDALVYKIVEQPTNGSLGNLNGNNIYYTPNSGFTGFDSFGYIVSNGGGGSKVAIVEFNVALAGKPIHMFSSTLPDGASGSYSEVGFTSTGLFFDKARSSFWVGNHGQANSEDLSRKPSIINLDMAGEKIINEIEVYKILPEVGTIQGVIIDKKDTIWFADPTTDKIYNITFDAEIIGSIDYFRPNGLGYDEFNDQIIVYSRGEVSVIEQGSQDVIRVYSVDVSGDQVYFDEDTQEVFITYGGNGDPAYINVYNHQTERFLYSITGFEENTAAEGVSIVDNNMFMVSDMFYHPEGEIDLNQFLVYGYCRNNSNICTSKDFSSH